jgi:hypothetical protein
LTGFLLLSAVGVAGCDPEACPDIGGEIVTEPAADHPEYAAAAESLTWQPRVLDAIDDDARSGSVQIDVDEVEGIEVSRGFDCGSEDTVDILGAYVQVRVQVTAPDGDWTLFVPAMVVDAHGAGALRFEPWSSEDPEVVDAVPVTDLDDDAQVGRIELEVTPTQLQLYRTDMVSCTTVEGCSNTTRHLLLSWAADGT